MIGKKRHILRIVDLHANSNHVPGDTCWHWAGAKNQAGEPRIYTFDHARGEKRSMSVAMAVYNIANQAAPGDLIAYRRCGVKDCVNPEHLKAALTRSDMLRDVFARGADKRRSKPRAPSEAQRAAIERGMGIALTPLPTVMSILRSSGTGRSIAAAHGVSESVVSKIRKRRSHKYLSVEACV